MLIILKGMGLQMRYSPPARVAPRLGQTGHPALDRQISEIVSLVQELRIRAAEAAASAEVLALERRLLERFKEHCAFQESLMALHRYPHHLRHRRHHEQILAESRDFLEAQDVAGGAQTRRFLDHWKLWCIVHVLQEDEAFGAFLRARAA